MIFQKAPLLKLVIPRLNRGALSIKVKFRAPILKITIKGLTLVIPLINFGYEIAPTDYTINQLHDQEIN